MASESLSLKIQAAKQQPSTGDRNPAPVKASDDLDQASSNRKPRKNRNRRNKERQQQPTNLDSNIALAMYSNDGTFEVDDKPVHGQQKQGSSSEEDTSKGKNKKRRLPRQPKPQRADSQIVINGTSYQPHPDVEKMNPVLRRNSPPTVNRTPAKQLYAGPTFHASPAPSELPIPSFFSKSLPAKDSQTSLQYQLDNEGTSSSDSSSGNESPPTSSSIPANPPPTREESPLDFFFKAVDEEKAKKAANSNLPTTPNGKLAVPSYQSAPPGNNWAQIYGKDYRHHSRAASADSQQGVFALELDGTGVQPNRHHQATPPRDNARSNAPATDQQNLRNYLNTTANLGSPSPRALPSPDRNLSGYSSDHINGSPFFRHQPQARSSSGPSTPSPFAQQTAPLHYGNRNLSPLFKAASNEPTARSSSSLRREVTASPIIGSAELPAFSSPTTSHPPSLARAKSTGNAPVRTAADLKTMEDDLRRMLKITAFSGGASGAPSMA